MQGILAKSGSLRARIIRGSFWSLVGATASYGMSFIASLACAKLLGKVGFGELGIIRNTISTMGIFAGLGLGVTATKHIAEFREKDVERTARIIQLCLWVAVFSGAFMTLVLMLGSSVIAENVLAAPHLAPSLLLGALLLFVYAYDGAQKGILAGFEAYRQSAVIHIIGGMTTVVSVFGGARYAGLNGALGGFVFSASIILLMNSQAIRTVRRQHTIPNLTQARDVWSEYKMLTTFSLPAFLSSSIVGPTLWIANTMLVNQPDGYAQMGIMSATHQINTFALFVPRSALQVLLPILAMELNKDVETPKSNRLMMLNSYTAFFLTTSLVSILLYFVPAILLLYGQDFSDGRIAMVFVLCSLPILTYKDGIARFIQAKSLLWLGFISNLVWALVLIVGSYLLVGDGANGLALATFLAYALNSIIFVPIYYKKLNMNRQLWRDAILGLVLTLALLPGALSNFFILAKHWLLLMFVCTCGLIYLAIKLMKKWFGE